MDPSAVTLIGIFLTGLALNLTPCVYPMLSVTVALFGKGKSGSIAKSFPKAFVYFLGIILVYSTLGVVTALTGGFFGSAIQKTWVLVLLAIFLLLLALSMFGVYEFRLPSQVVNWAGGKKRTGTLGIFLSGLLVGIVAAPCIGPPIVALLTMVGQSQDPKQGLIVFFILSLGLGLPYLILGTFSGLMSRLPKSGEWMIWVERLFGFAILGLSFFYFALGLYADLLPYVVPLTVLLAGVYLGFIETSGDKNPAFKRAKRLLGAVAIFLVLFIMLRSSKEGVVWEPYTVEKFEAAIESGQPIVVDVFADWCIPCHELDQFTYTHPKVIEALAPFARFKVDATNPKSEVALEPIKRFKVVGVPTVLFVDTNGQEAEEARITGYVPPEVFLDSVSSIDLSGDNK